MRLFKTALFIVIASFAFHHAKAQKDPAKKPPTTKFQKIKPPKLNTLINGHKDSVTVMVSVAEAMIGMPLKIYDDKKVEYGISSYQFLYRKKGVTEDEKGNVSPTTTVSSERFKVTPLPELWVNIIRQQVKKGDEFYFFDVIAKDAQGRVMYAPDLKIMIQ